MKAEPFAWAYQNANTEHQYLVWHKQEGGRNWMPLFTHQDVQEAILAELERIIAANAPEIERINAHIKALEDELKSLREFAAGRCTIQKVIDELGPMSLWSYAGMEKKLDEVRAEEREACAKLCDELQSIPATEPRHCAEDIRARGQQ